jgi:hypothetical protein
MYARISKNKKFPVKFPVIQKNRENTPSANDELRLKGKYR